MKKIIPFICLVLSSYSFAAEKNLGIGVSGSWAQSPYKGDSEQFSPMPLIDYDSQFIFMSGTSGGIHLWQNESQQFNLALEYQSFELKPSDNDNWRMKRLDRRRSTLLSGLSYSIVTQYGQLSTEALFDTLNSGHGLSIDFQYAGLVQLTDNLSLVPQLGVTWYNHSYNNYYYGVSNHESQRSGFDHYNAGSGFTPRITLTSVYEITPHWSTVFEYEYTTLSHEVKSSPIVNRSNINTFNAGVIYYF